MEVSSISFRGRGSGYRYLFIDGVIAERYCDTNGNRFGLIRGIRYDYEKNNVIIDSDRGYTEFPEVREVKINNINKDMVEIIRVLKLMEK